MDKLTVRTGDGLERPLPLYLEPAEFEHLDFFATDGSLAGGAVRFRAYAPHGELLHEREAGQLLPFAPPGQRRPR